MRIACGDGFVGNLVENGFGPFAARYPQIRLQVGRGSTESILQSVAEGESDIGLAIIIGAVIVGYALYRLTLRRAPAVIWVSLVGTILTYPATPFAADITALTAKIIFLARATPMLAFAGLSIAKDLPVFRRLGWRIVVVSLLANTGTFLGAALIAQLLLQTTG